MEKFVEAKYKLVESMLIKIFDRKIKIFDRILFTGRFSSKISFIFILSSGMFFFVKN